MTAKKTLREKYPQFADENGKFDEKSFCLKDLDSKDIEEILSRRKSIEIYLDNLDNIMDNPLESIGVIFKMITKYCKKVNLVLEEIREEIRKEIPDEKLAEATFRDFRWFSKNLKLGTEEYIKTAIANGFKPKKSTSPSPEDNPLPRSPRYSKYGGGITDLEGCS